MQSLVYCFIGLFSFICFIKLYWFILFYLFFSFIGLFFIFIFFIFIGLLFFQFYRFILFYLVYSVFPGGSQVYCKYSIGRRAGGGGPERPRLLGSLTSRRRSIDQGNSASFWPLLFGLRICFMVCFVGIYDACFICFVSFDMILSNICANCSFFLGVIS